MKRIALAGLCAALVFCLTLVPAFARAASNLEIISASLSPASPCPGDTCTLSITLRDLVNAPAFTPTLYAAEEPSADFNCDSKGFSTDWNPPVFWWDIDANTVTSTPTALSNRMGWPNDGGWKAPLSLSYTGQTYTQDFQVGIGSTDDLATAYQIYIGASSGIQGSSGADSYYCLTFTTCAQAGAPAPAGSPAATETAGPTEVPGPLALTGTAKPSLSVVPNILKSGGQVAITLVSGGGGAGKLRILRRNKSVLQTLWSGSLAPGQKARISWDTVLDSGDPAPGGVYYVAFTDGDKATLLRKMVIIP